jgi:hypothetical protein
MLVVYSCPHKLSVLLSRPQSGENGFNQTAVNWLNSHTIDLKNSPPGLFFVLFSRMIELMQSKASKSLRAEKSTD